jgi:hypothetical protein
MPAATRLQLRRGLALAATLVLVVCNLLAMRHEAVVAHATDARGIARHVAGAAAECSHTATQTHAHSLPAAPAGDGDPDACDLVSIAHASAIASPPVHVVAVAVAAIELVVAARAPRAHAVIVPLHAAPKTSPPLA